MVVDPGARIDRGRPRSVRVPVGHDDAACRSVALNPDEGFPPVDLHSARVRVGAVESQVDGLRPSPVGVSRRNVDVEFVERVRAVVNPALSGPESTGGCAPALMTHGAKSYLEYMK